MQSVNLLARNGHLKNRAHQVACEGVQSGGENHEYAIADSQQGAFIHLAPWQFLALGGGEGEVEENKR